MRMHLAVGLALVVTTIAQAQGREPLRQPESVPHELASALAAAGGFHGTAPPQVLVGEIPQWALERIALPANATILGSAFMGATVMAVVKVPEDPAVDVAALERALGTRGWSRARLMGTEGGFRPMSIEGPSLSRLPMTLCSERNALYVSAGASRAGRRSILIRLMDPASTNPCNPPQGVRGPPRDRAQLPTLYNPAGTPEQRMGGNCATEPEGDFRTASFSSTRLTTQMAVADLLDHYGRQLADSGWTPAAASTTMNSRWTRRDSSGKVFNATLIATTTTEQPACRELQLRVTEMDRP